MREDIFICINYIDKHITVHHDCCYDLLPNPRFMMIRKVNTDFKTTKWLGPFNKTELPKLKVRYSEFHMKVCNKCGGWRYYFPKTTKSVYKNDGNKIRRKNEKISINSKSIKSRTYT